MSKYIGYRILTALFVVMGIAFASMTVFEIVNDGGYHIYLLCAVMSAGLAYTTNSIAALYETLDAAEMLITILEGKLRREQAARKRDKIRDSLRKIPVTCNWSGRDEEGACGGE